MVRPVVRRRYSMLGLLRLLKIMNLQQIGRNYYNPSDPIDIPNHRDDDVQRELRDWGLSFDSNLLSFSGRILQSEKIHQGGKTFDYNPQFADWSKETRGTRLISVKPLDNWLLIYTRRNYEAANSLIQNLFRVTPAMGIRMQRAIMIEVDDRTEAYLRVLQQKVTPNTQMAGCLADAWVGVCLAQGEEKATFGLKALVLEVGEVTGRGQQPDCRSQGEVSVHRLLSTEHAAMGTSPERGCLDIETVKSTGVPHTLSVFFLAQEVQEQVVHKAGDLDSGLPCPTYYSLSSCPSQRAQVVCLLSSNRKDKYDAIKKYLCTDCPTPSQCVVARTLGKQQTVMAIATKMALQMNCKMGGELWRVDMPLKQAMIVGIDCYHDTTAGRRSIAGFVASINEGMTR
ncbi:hypothetical protein NN561_013078 [Cricetulus griseus]